MVRLSTRTGEDPCPRAPDGRMGGSPGARIMHALMMARAWRQSVRRGLASFATVATVVAAAAPAQAQSDSAADARYAERLFQQAKNEMLAGHVAEACTTFEAVWRIDGGGGTLLALATCHEKLGHGAQALGEFRQARALAASSGRAERVELAEEHIADLERSVSRLTVSTSPVKVPGLTVDLDGVPIDSTRWDSPFPVDGGTHVVHARVPGAPPWETTVVVAPRGDSPRVDLPSWESAPPAASPRPPGPAAPARAGPNVARVAGIAVGAAGAVGIAVGAVFGVVALQKRHDALARCGGSTTCSDSGSYQEARSLDAQSSSAGLVSSIAIVSGAGVLTAGVLLAIFGRPSDGRPAVSVGVFPGGGEGTLSMPW